MKNSDKPTPAAGAATPGGVTTATEAVMQVLQARAESARQATAAGRCGQWMFIDAMGLRESIATSIAQGGKENG